MSQIDYVEMAKQWPGEWAGNGHDSWITAIPEMNGYSLISRAEIAFLLHHTPETGKFLEIGTAFGVTAALIAKARPGITILCVDNFSMPWPDSDCLISWRANKQPNMNLWYGTTSEMIEFFRFDEEWCLSDGYFDIVLADADHTFDPTLKTLHEAAFLLRPGGVIIAHDWGNPGWPEVAPAVDAFCAESGFSIIDSFGIIVALGKP